LLRVSRDGGVDRRGKRKGIRKRNEANRLVFYSFYFTQRRDVLTDDGEIDLEVAGRRVLEVDATAVNAFVVELHGVEGENGWLR
jgi:hypothetical protein